MLDINLEKLNKIIDDFYSITGVMIGAYDKGMKRLSAAKIPHCALCEAVRQYPHLAERCRACDQNGLKLCAKRGKITTYTCHMGLTEAVAPLYSGGVLAGYVLIGQMPVEGEDAEIHRRIEALESNVDKGALHAAATATPSLQKSKMDSIISLMDICTQYLMVERVVNIKSSLLSRHIAEYIKAHLAAPLGISALCREFGISRTRLYDLSKDFFGMGITDYIRLVRIEESKRLLRERELLVGEIAELVGLQDPNYFSKVFRRMTGASPSEYRKAARGS